MDTSGFEIGFLSPLYTAVTWVMTHLHNALSTFIPAGSGLNWALTIVLLTCLMRILIFPLFVKQIKSSKKMQQLAPEIQALRKKYKNDRQRLSEKTMELYKREGANPLGGCFPILAQFPIFIAMFGVLNRMAHNDPHPDWGLTASIVESAQGAKIFGVPLPAWFFMSDTQFAQMAGLDEAWPTKAVLLVFVAISAVSTYLMMDQSTKRQMKQLGDVDPDSPMAKQAGMMKFMKYLSPLFAIFSLNFPLGVILYWVTTNVWTLVQSHLIYGNLDKKQAALEAAVANGKVDTTGGSSSPGMLGKLRKKKDPEPEPPAPKVVRDQSRQPTRQARSKRGSGKKS